MPLQHCGVRPEQQAPAQTVLPAGQHSPSVLHCPMVGQQSPSTPPGPAQQMFEAAQHSSAQLTVPAAQHSPSLLHSCPFGQQTKLVAPGQTRP
jgi:hypothetical protein